MSDKEIAKIRAQLEARLEALRGRLAEINETLREPEDADLYEQAADLDDDVILERLSRAGRIQQYLIEAALKRIDGGVYGKCVECGKDIAETRLKALPEAERCLSCARKSIRH
jgi:RNA polymerase-binding transcription factor DksA